MTTTRHLALTLIAALFLFTQACVAVAAKGPAPYDRPGDANSTTVAAEGGSGVLTATREQEASLEYYEQLVAELQRSGGVYDVRLSEVLMGLGDTYLALQRYADAVSVYERSLHIARVNDGLYSLSQVVPLEKLIEVNTRLNDWEALDSNYHSLYWINKRHYGDNNPELLALIERIGRWHLEAYEMESEERAFSHLADAERLYDEAMAILDSQGKKNALRLINILYGIALTNYQIAVQASSAEDFDDIRSGFRDSNRARRMLQEQRARQDLILRSYRKGRDAMSRIVDIHASNPILPVDTHAMALTHLGDWFLLFNKRNSARETYEKAYQLLKEDGMPQEEIDKLFGQPRTLPAIRLPNPRRDDLMPEDPPYVLASFDVSPSGKARNIEIIESSPEDNVSYKRRAKRSIANTKFRPRYEDGKPVLTTGVSLRYVFTD